MIELENQLIGSTSATVNIVSSLTTEILHQTTTSRTVKPPQQPPKKLPLFSLVPRLISFRIIGVDSSTRTT